MMVDIMDSIIFRPGVSLIHRYVRPDGIHLNSHLSLMTGGHHLESGMASDFVQLIVYSDSIAKLISDAAVSGLLKTNKMSSAYENSLCSS